MTVRPTVMQQSSAPGIPVFGWIAGVAGLAGAVQAAVLIGAVEFVRELLHLVRAVDQQHHRNVLWSGFL